ncbi:MAG: DUF4331 family protein [Candidatus Eremiobacteraeota bacterium]|nr:DUF4331 family protein [Candidatus Eremiobacteraeota bacterium]
MIKHIALGVALGALIAVGVSACSGNASPFIGPSPAPSAAAKYIQIELLSRPAVKEAFENFADHDTTNRTEPYNDPTLQSEIGTFTTTVAGRSATWASALQSTLYPNEMLVNLTSNATTAAYLGVETNGLTGSTFGGRALTDDTIKLSLGAIFGNTLTALGVPDDGKESPCLIDDHVTATNQTTSTFPYAQPPI